LEEILHVGLDLARAALSDALKRVQASLTQLVVHIVRLLVVEVVHGFLKDRDDLGKERRKFVSNVLSHQGEALHLDHSLRLVLSTLYFF
jgi:hypothetical protein